MSWRRIVAAQGLLAAVYFFAGKFGLSLAFWHASATAVWPPSGICLTALLFWGTRLWPGVFLGAFLVNVTTAGNIATSLGIAAGNTLEAVAGAWLVRRFAGGREAFHRVHTLISFILLAGLVSTTISATIGVTTLALGSFLPWARYGAIWFTWWLGDVVSNLTIAPLLIIWLSWPRPPFRLRQAAEIAVVLLALVGIGQWVFGGWGISAAGRLPVEFVTIPVLLWTAFRLGLRVTVTAAVLLSWLALRGTLHGVGPFATPDPNASLLLLQAFMGVATMTALILAAAITERQRAEEALRQARDELESRVQARTSELQRALEELKDSNEEQKATYLQLIQAAKMESIGRLAAGVAHEVKNPLAIILQGVDFLSKHLSDQDGNTALVLKYTGDAVRRADAVIRGLLDFSTSRKLELAPADLNDIMERAVLLVKHELDRSHVQVVKTLAPELPPVALDHNKMEQVFVNLFLNAISAMPSGGTLTIATQARRLDAVGPQVGLRIADRFKLGDTVMVVEVSDTGPGIPDDVLPKIFDPFFTTKPSGQGTGLGLTVTKKIIELHGGLIEIRNQPDGGVKATLALRVKGGERAWRKSASFSSMTR